MLTLPTTNAGASGDASSPAIFFRPPVPEDAGAMTALVKACPPLDTNSAYAYLLLGYHHSATCVVAERDGKLVGLMTAYRPPARPASLFIWQVAVHGSARRQGLAGRMLRNLLGRPACCGIRWLETTIGPSNQPSYAFFAHAASLLQAPMTQAGLFQAGWLGEPVHEDEVLYRIGPLPSAVNAASTDGGTNANDQ